MKTTRTYQTKCYNCNGSGVDYTQITGMNASAICIVCNGTKLITVTETSEDSDAQQCHPLKEITDEDIEKEAEDYASRENSEGRHFIDNPAYEGFFDGCKWLRDKQKEVKQ